jgi:hypothetical protein
MSRYIHFADMFYETDGVLEAQTRATTEISIWKESSLLNSKLLRHRAPNLYSC